ncbi:HNH endonuclease [Shewanella algae]|uniref:HNH endonuclease n=1 Tax=Shewanella algae TaxID=38313 RepID=UPI001AAC915E|nr:HNH endonuclease [Shewanella algae]MBO2702205.1 HNH endonuclease [Shewanella algae]
MELEIQVNFRTGDSIRTRRYKSEQGALRGIWKWLSKHQDKADIQASFFSPELGHRAFEHPEQLSEFEPKTIDNFYQSRAWLALRYQVLQTHEHKCVECNRTKAEHNIVLHVDHILPRSKYPHKALDINNMQILCEDCNLGKLDK